ncbi:hypothetical protein BT93_C2350 [Corymbia citriodora subsp. variegata]|nr:hypothetical protein BT93_C2350 [Corymbia citriodora subsp. variegata]
MESIEDQEPILQWEDAIIEEECTNQEVQQQLDPPVDPVEPLHDDIPANIVEFPVEVETIVADLEVLVRADGTLPPTSEHIQPDIVSNQNLHEQESKEKEDATIQGELGIEGLVSSPTPPPPPLPLPPRPPPPLVSSQPRSSISTSSRNNFEVFLSFRGPDTRTGFADCLYTSLIHAGIIVFRDDNELEPGENIPDALVQSIKQSKISIPILSKDYASSKSCLMELAQMVECEEADAQLIVPIFYDIDPADLKYQRGCVGESFSKHEHRRIDCRVIDKWKQALGNITEMKGHNLQNTTIGHGKIIETVVSYILEWLNKNDLKVRDGLVGMEPRVREVMKKLGVVYVNEQATQVYDKDVRVLGICGMPGIGKTTLAKVVYRKIRHLFQRCSFISIIQKKGVYDGLVMGWQKQLISDLRGRQHTWPVSLNQMTDFLKISLRGMKVLILLDDVYHFDQIKHLAGECSWFHPESRILVTVGNVNVLDGYGNGVADKYEVGEMELHQALQLFRMHAFNGYTREEEDEYDSWAKEIVYTIRGIPLAIEVTASYLHKYKGNRQVWQDTLESFRRKPEDEVQKAFDLSYASLNKETQEIFLDIACFFIGMDERIPPYMWSAYKYDPRGIMTLRDMSLIKTGENNELWMHNQLREFGREIVRKEDPREPQNCSRLWNHKEALSMLKGEQSPDKVEALGLTFDEGQSECLRRETFSHLGRLRFLRLDRATIGGSQNIFGYLGRLRSRILDQATVGGSSQNVLSNLRWLDWQGCRQISELLIFHLEDLVILDLSRSLVNGDSLVWEQILKKAKKLKVLNLSNCCNLNAFPDFRALMHLERLVLEHCSALSQIGPLIGNLKKLVSLNLKFCSFVSDLPQELCHLTDLEELLIDGTAIREIDFKPASMKKLKILIACQCKSLAHISDPIGDLESLVHLRLEGAAIEQLPDTIESLKKLQSLLLGNCQNLRGLPPSIGNLESLEVMDLSSTNIGSLPRSIEHLKNLQVLKMQNTHLEEFPKDIKDLEKLEEIDLSKCWNLKGWITCDIRGLSSLKILRLSSTVISGLPCSLELLSHLQQLDLSKCDQLRDLQRLPSSLSILRWGSKTMGTVPDLSFLRYLKELYLGDNFDPTDPVQNSSSEPPQIDWLTRLANLEILELCRSEIAKLPEHFSKLQLRKLFLHSAYLRDLRELPSSLSVLCLQHCMIRSSQFSTVKSLSELELKQSLGMDCQS